MRVSQNGVDLIKRFEGLELVAYRDNADTSTGEIYLWQQLES